MAHLNTTSYPAHSKDADNMVNFQTVPLVSTIPYPYTWPTKQGSRQMGRKKKKRIIRKGKNGLKWMSISPYYSHPQAQAKHCKIIYQK